MASFSAARFNRRRLPSDTATVSVHSDEKTLAYGVIVNISEAGACLATEIQLPTGVILPLRLSFYRHSEVLETDARIIWCRGGDSSVGKEMQDLLLHGVQFEFISEKHQKMLNQLLDAFPIELGSEVSCELDDLQNELKDILDLLGTKLESDISGTL